MPKTPNTTPPLTDDTKLSDMYSFLSMRSHDKLRALLQTDPSLINQCAYGISPVHFTIIQGETSTFEILHQFGADINERDDFGETPAHIAARYGKVDFLRTLNLLGADLYLTDNLGRTLAHTAARNNHKDILIFLSQLNFDLNIEDKYGYRPVDIIATAIKGKEPLGMLTTLRQLGINIDSPNSQGMTPAHHAVIYGNIAMLHELLSLGANLHAVNSQDNNYTSAHYAALNPNQRTFEVLQLLQRLGVCLNTRNLAGKTPADIADDCGWAEIKQELERLSQLPAPDDNAYFTFNCLAAIALGIGAVMLAIALLPLLPTTIATYVAYAGAGFVAGGLLLGAYGFFTNNHTKTGETSPDEPTPSEGLGKP